LESRVVEYALANIQVAAALIVFISAIAVYRMTKGGLRRWAIIP